jgi:4-diphosphocytidyl-2-C-methyl-D-erythritol kinase
MSHKGAFLLIRCPAKLNLFLEVVRRRPDGYHDLDTVMQAIDLYDELRVFPRAEPTLTMECDDASLPTDERNLVLRAAIALRDHACHRAGAHFVLAKRIPSQAGLGGGSSDAAGALIGLNRAWGLGLSTEALRQLAAAVGSDVAFFLYGGAARCTGRGEAVEPLAVGSRQHYILLCPPVAVSTAEAYRNLRFPLTSAPADATMLARSLAKGDIEGLGHSLYNRLEEPAFALRPELRELKGRLAATGLFAGVGMTGSGSALFGLCGPGHWQRAHEGVAALHLGAVHAVQSISRGVAVQPE